MNFSTWWNSRFPKINRSHRIWCSMAWDSASHSEREDCASLIWEHRGKCVSDESARALMEVIRGGQP